MTETTILPSLYPGPFYAPHLNQDEREFRILVTGWRLWPHADRAFIGQVLYEVWMYNCTGFGGPDGSRPAIRLCTVVDGACPYGGVDHYAHKWAMSMGLSIRSERHPAAWDGPKLLGKERNSEMVAAGADIALAFPGPGSGWGTMDCMKKIINANIPMKTFPYQSDVIGRWRATGRIEGL